MTARDDAGLSGAEKAHDLTQRAVDRTYDLTQSAIDKSQELGQTAVGAIGTAGHYVADAVSSTSNYVKDFEFAEAKKQIRESIVERPGVSVAIAGIFGLLIGLSLGRRSR